MTRPGDRLRALAERWCGADTLARVVDPLIADLQAEHYAAQASGRVWRSRRIRIAGAIALLKVLALCGARQAALPWREWPAEDRRAIVRTVAITTMAVAGYAVLMVFRAADFVRMLPADADRSLVFYLIPQAVPIALPVGLAFGAFLGLGRGFASIRARSAILLLALCCSAASLAMMWWIAPPANQAFRVGAYKAFMAKDGQSVQADMPAKGSAELTLGELREHIDAADAQGATVALVNELTFRYHQRAALPFASLAFGLIAIVAAPRRAIRVWMLVAASAITCWMYFALLEAGSRSREFIPIILAAWLPNLVFGVLAGVLMVRRALSTRRVVAAR